MVSQMWRRAFFPASLALIRLRARAGRSLLVALGIAVGAALLAVADGGSAAVRDRAVQRALTELGPSQTSVQAVWSGVPAQSALPLASLDRHAKAALRPVTGETPFALMLFREARFGGGPAARRAASSSSSAGKGLCRDFRSFGLSAARR